MDQYRGALGRAFAEVSDCIDQGQVDATIHRLRLLERYADVGLHLTEPWRVVLTGYVNVGKSSLINSILGYQRSIAYKQPGTTRDVVTAHTAIDGWLVELMDTAGLRDSGDAIESAGVAMAQQRLDAADLVVIVLDSTEPWSARAGAMVAKRPNALIVHNKCDLVSRLPDDRPQGLQASAATGQGIPQLIDAVSARLVRDPPSTGTAVPFRDRHVRAVQAALLALSDRDLSRTARVIDGVGQASPLVIASQTRLP
jgi:tRNA modification GTPase